MPRLLLCPPDFYGIEYEINPWMDLTHKADTRAASGQWGKLRKTLLSVGCEVDLIEARPGLPDMVFTANAGLVFKQEFIRANFRYPQREGEAKPFEEWFSTHRYETVSLPQDLIFEGEGDALFCGEVLFCGYHFRSDIQSHQWLGTHLGCLVISVELVDPRFYHLDTCFCPLSGSTAIWYPPAFDEYGQAAIRAHVHDLIDVSPGEAFHFACNAIVLGKDLVMPSGCPELAETLSQRGFRWHDLDMSEFMKAGGACKCLTLFLSRD
jgi:N-dimethylarginine dimethylaminohydrolase